MTPPIRSHGATLRIITLLAMTLLSSIPAFAVDSDGVATVPEPLSFTLLGLGLIGLVSKKVIDRRRGK